MSKRILDLNKWASTVVMQQKMPNEFVRWLEGPLKEFYPYQGLVLTHGELKAGEINVTHFLATGHQENYLKQLQTSFDLSVRGGLARWFSTRMPLLIDLNSPLLCATEYEIQEMKDFQFSTVAGHGVLNPKGNAGTYFGFTNVEPPLDDWHDDALQLLAPYLNSAFLRHISRTTNDSTSNLKKMTGGQQKIVRLLMQGHDNKTIARKLGIGEKTVRNQLSAVYSRTGTRSRAGLIALIG